MTPNIQIYFFEDAMEAAVQAHLLANGINDVRKQRDDVIDIDGKKLTLKAPRVECKFVYQGFSTEKVWVNQTTKEQWLSTGYGQLILKVVTRRDQSDPTHAWMRGMCRWLMQNRTLINGFMPLHYLEKIIEQSSTISFQADEMHDASAMSFNVAITIKPSSFPQT